MVQNMRAYFILYVITIKFVKCVQTKIEYSSMLERPKLISIKIFGDLFLVTKINNVKRLQENSQGWQKDGILLPRGGICHIMPPHSYGPARVSSSLRDT